MASDIDLKKMKQALSEYGSLEKVNQGLEAQKREMESQIAALLPTRDQLKQEVSSLKSEKAALRAALKDLDGKLEERRCQYRLFTGFMALVTAQDPQDIAQFAASAQEWPTLSVANPESARGRILKQLMGSVVKSFRCSTCGTRFLVDRGPQWPRGKHRCPACSSWQDAEPDDALVKLFLSPEQIQETKEIDKLRAEVERLKPVEVFLDIPCAMCSKPLPNKWKRESIEKFFKANGLAHPECWNTPAGQLLLLRMACKELSSP
ncbi:MAG: hypothetical protein KJ624_00050 [Chloroflexi bacterium]|nr:hypothetical protein [Chloroflexota bacterium]